MAVSPPTHICVDTDIYFIMHGKNFLVFNNPRSQLSDSVYLLHFNFFIVGVMWKGNRISERQKIKERIFIIREKKI